MICETLHLKLRDLQRETDRWGDFTGVTSRIHSTAVKTSDAKRMMQWKEQVQEGSGVKIGNVWNWILTQRGIDHIIHYIAETTLYSITTFHTCILKKRLKIKGYITNVSVFTGLLTTAYLKKSTIKNVVAQEEDALNLINCLQLLSCIVGNVGSRFWKGKKNAWNKKADISRSVHWIWSSGFKPNMPNMVLLLCTVTYWLV